MKTPIPSEVWAACFPAAESGDIPRVEQLIVRHKRAAEIAFSKAAECSQFELCNHLLQHHREKISHKSIQSAFQTAFARANEQAAFLLLGAGAAVDEPVSYFGDTPLMAAARSGMTRVVSELIERGADLEKRVPSLVARISGSTEGDTALIHAVRWDCKTHMAERIECIRLLIAAGANVDAIGDNGKTALDRASASAKRAEIKKLLVAAGAKSAKELRPAKVAPATPKPKSPKPVEGIHNFSQASALLANLCGSQPQAHPQLPRAQFFQFRPAAGERAPIGKALLKRLEKIRHEAAPQVGKAGCWVVRTHELNSGLGLCLLRAKDKFDVVQQFKFGSGGWGVTTAAALKFLRALDRTASFTLLACDKSALSGRFQALPKSGLTLAKTLHQFCPFVCDDFNDDVKTLAKHLERGGEFTVWWD